MTSFSFKINASLEVEQCHTMGLDTGWCKKLEYKAQNHEQGIQSEQGRLQ